MDKPKTLSSVKPEKPTNQDEAWGWNYHICIFLAAVHVIGIVGAFYVPLTRKTFWFSVFYYFFTGLGITAGHHRLWAHRSYNASTCLEIFLALAAAGAVQGSIRWWCQEHRAHHRYTDKDKDPHSMTKGFLWGHMGWILVRPPKGGRRSGRIDMDDLKKNKVVVWQDKLYVPVFLIMSYVVPTMIAWKLWDDAWGGFVYTSALRFCILFHSTMFGNSLGHWLGEATFEDKHTPRDHFITALVTIGEGYHNFHHQFPMDYRSSMKWYHYDPTKWFIWSMKQLGLASQLKAFPQSEIRKGQLATELKKLLQVQDNLNWPPNTNDLLVVSWESFQEQSTKRPLVLIAGFIHDLTNFADEHPGGANYIKNSIGRDVTASFFGGVYNHSNAAHNLLSMKRVGILHGGYQSGTENPTSEACVVPLSQRLHITKCNEWAESRVLAIAGSLE